MGKKTATFNYHSAQIFSEKSSTFYKAQNKGSMLAFEEAFKRRFADLLLALFKAIRKVSVLDPTCGSGAFLFAALNILEPLYRASLDRMRALFGDWETREEASQISGGIRENPQSGRAPPERELLHLQIHHRPQPLRRGHHGRSRGNLQTPPLSQARCPA